MRKSLSSYDLFLLGASISLAILHVSAWSHYPPDVDPINFTVALHRFSPAEDAPHPPGYPLFVFAARMASVLVGDNHAYQTVNLGMLLSAGGFIYLLFRHLKNPTLGVFSALLMMSHPLAWAATVIPECYISDTFFACGILVWVVTQRSRPRVLFSGVLILFFLLGLIRPVSAVMLLPMAMTACFLLADSRNFRTPMMLATLAITAIALAYFFTAYVSGGLLAYRSAALRVMGGAFSTNSVLGGASITAHVKMLAHLGGWFLLLAWPAVVVLTYALLKKRYLLKDSRYRHASLIGSAWLLPPLMFYSFIYYLKPTYQLIYLPCLLIPVAWAFTQQAGWFNRKTSIIAFTLLVLAQLALFWYPFPHLPQVLFRQTEAYVKQQDQAWDYLLKNLSALPTSDTLLIWMSHPSLSVYAVRLLKAEGPIATVKTGSNELNYLMPTTMSWLPSGPADKVIDAKYQAALVIENVDGKAVVRYVPLPNPLSHQVDYLLKHHE